MPDGGVLTVGLDADSDRVRISVRDTGIGLDPGKRLDCSSLSNPVLSVAPGWGSRLFIRYSRRMADRFAWKRKKVRERSL